MPHIFRCFECKKDFDLATHAKEFPKHHLADPLVMPNLIEKGAFDNYSLLAPPAKKPRKPSKKKK